MPSHYFIRILLFIGLSATGFISNGQKHSVYIVQAGWHTGIVLETADIPFDIFKEAQPYTRDKYLDVSWGEEKYYQIPEPGIFLSASTILWPTRAAISMTAYSREIKNYYRKPIILEITITKEAYFALCNFLSDAFQRDKTGKIIPSTFYRDSSGFFLAKRKYSMFRTCNTWVALALKKSGLEISPFLLVTTRQLFRRLNKLDNTRYLELVHKDHCSEMQLFSSIRKVPP